MFLASLYRGMRLALFAGTLAISASAVFAQSVTLQGHLPALLDSAQKLSRVEAAEPVSLALVLPLRNQDQLTDLLRHLYTPGDPLYGKYLTPEQFAQQFSPTQDDYNAILAFARSRGLTVTATSPNRTIVDVVGNAQTVEQAFGVQLNQYQANGGRLFRAPSTDPQIPAGLLGRLAAVVGLDTAAVWKTHSREKLAPPKAASGPRVMADPRQIGSGPGGGLTPSDIKSAYNLTGISANGSGQSLALFELTGYTASDISAYESYYGLPNVALQNVLIDGFSGAAGSGADEVTLDIELQIAVAPSISKIYVYEGPNSNQGVMDTYNKIATDNLAKSVSTSWGIAENSMSSLVRNSENQAFQQMAAQGQSIFAASGDNGADDNGSTLSVDDPASQAYMTGVGGTSLVTNGAGGAWSSETVWNGGSIGAGAGGGGVSTVWAKPAYQAGVGTSPTFRNVPDVALDANPNTGYSVFYGGGWRVYGGTSCSAPIWSGFVACVNQSRVAAAKSTLGFANTLLYQLGAGANYKSDFRDVNDNSTNLFYHATTGYDNATGWGTINGAGLFPDLVNGGAVNSSPTTVYRIHAGSGTIGAFNSDNYFTGGSLYPVSQSIDTSAANSAPMAVYQTSRYGNFSYIMPGLTPGTSCTVRLHFAETYFTVPGQRPSNVAINGAPVLTNFDIATAAGGANRALVEQFTATADSNGKITITFSGANNPLVNGIEILTSTVASGPNNLKATAGNAQVSLTWDAVSGATSYNIYRSQTSGSGYTKIGSSALASGTDATVTNGTTYYYVVTAVTSPGESANSSEASATPSSVVALYRIHAGSGTIGSFNSDSYFIGGSLYSVSQSIDTSAANAAPMAVYQTCRYGNFAYVMPGLTPGTNYTVRLHFAETYFTVPGQRPSNVAINGSTVLSNFDIATAAGGANKAIVEQFTATADILGRITIAFSGANNPLVNGIEILH